MSTSKTLGCCTDYEVALYNRTGTTQIAILDTTTEVRWSRRLDDTGEAEVVVSIGGTVDSSCCEELGKVRSWHTNLKITRCGTIVFEGPIVGVIYEPGLVRLSARDVSAWLGRRIQPAGTYTGNIAEIGAQLARESFLRDDPNVVPHITTLTGTTPAVSRVYEANSVYVLDALRALGEEGLDWTTIGRRLVFRDATREPSVLAGLRDDDFQASIQMVEVGQDAATRVVVLGKPPEGSPDGTPDPVGACGGVDPYFGLVELLIVDDNVPDDASATAAACGALALSDPPPLRITIPEGATISPTAPIGIDELVPGWSVDVAITTLCRSAARRFRISEVVGTIDPEGEKIGMTLTPFVSRAAA